MAKVGKRLRRTDREGYLDGQMLIAMPAVGDPFERSLIYLFAHSEDGAMGLVVNRPARTVTFTDLLVQLDIIAAGEAITLPREAGGVPVIKGGPVETGRGFVLHSADFHIEDSTLAINDGVSLTATLDILRAIARGAGPDRAVLALGYAGWAAGQLESEIQSNGWLNCPADPDLLFDRSLDTKYERALRKLGVDSGQLSGEAGHA